MKNQSKKIGLILTYGREINMYNWFYNQNDYVIDIILNDLPTSIAQKKSAKSETTKALKKNNINYSLASDLLRRKKKYDLIFSPGSLTVERFSFFYFALYIYANTFGKLAKYLGFEKIKIPFFKIGITGKSFLVHKKKLMNIENRLGKKNIFLPSGLDCSLKSFPLERWQSIFDYFLCHSKIDQNLIKKKFRNSKTIIIGHPRFQKYNSNKKARDRLLSEFNINPKSKIVVWLPTDIKIKEEFMQNITLWSKKISDNFRDWAIILRPHPKTWDKKILLNKNLNKFNFLIDNKKEQDFEMLIKGSDLVLADYGDTVLSSIYLKKPTVILNLPKSYAYRRGLENSKSLDIIARKNIINIDLDNFKILKKINTKKSFSKISHCVTIASKKFFKNGQVKQEYDSTIKIINKLV
tara:strand:+ start:281 stop:1507 length:1227 start_codon:yes stop_codon:yes gene_type:complete